MADRISIQNISFSYPNKAPIFSHFSTSIHTETATALTTPSGSGKTTLLHLIAGLIKPQEGQILFPQSHNRISMVFQENRLIPSASIAKNIRLVNKKLTDSEIFSLLKQAKLERYAACKPSSLSGGEQRRTAIIRALAADYDILLLDEPFTGLDAGIKETISQFIHNRTQSKTLILVTHNPEDIALLKCKMAVQL